MFKDLRRFGLVATLVITYFAFPESWLDHTRQSPYFSEDELRRIALTLRAPELPSFQTEDYHQAELGEKIFFETRFSSNDGVACGSCHIPALHFTDSVPVAEGLGKGHRNTPSLVNLAWSKWFFWDGRADSLVAQALQPFEAPLEHGISRGRLVQILFAYYRDDYEAIFPAFSPELASLLKAQTGKEWHAIPGELFDEKPRFSTSLASYGVATINAFGIQTRLIRDAHRNMLSPQDWFNQQAFQTADHPKAWIQEFEQLDPRLQAEINQIFWNVGKSLASFQRGLTAIDSPFDRFLERLSEANEIDEALNEEFSEEHWQGFQHFVASDCVSCHHGPMLTDHQFHNIGLPQLDQRLDLGRAVGAIQARHSLFRCDFVNRPSSDPGTKGHSTQAPSESCAELEFIDYDNAEMMGAFKTPSLRNLGRTAPYMRDGRFKDLSEVLQHYNELDESPAIGHREETLRPLRLTKQELAALEAFLLSLDSEVHSYFETWRQRAISKSAE